MNAHKIKGLKGTKKFSPEDPKALNDIRELLHDTRLKCVVFHHDHCQMEAVDENVIKKELREVAFNLRSILDYLCTILSLNSKRNARIDSLKMSFPFCTGNPEVHDLETIFEEVREDWSKTLFAKDYNDLTKGENDVLQIIFRVQPLTQVFNGSATEPRDQSLKTHVFEAYLFYTMNLFRNDVTHKKSSEVTVMRVNGVTLQCVEQNGAMTQKRINNTVMFVSLPETKAGNFPKMQIISTVVPLWIKLVTKIVSRCLYCVSESLGKKVDDIISETSVSWNDDVLVVRGEDVSWKDYSKIRLLGRGNE